MCPHNSTSLWCYPGHISYLGPFQTHLGSLKSTVASANISAVQNLSWAVATTKHPDTFINLLLCTLDSVFSSMSVVLSSCVCLISQYQTFLSALFSPTLPYVWCPLCKDSYKISNLHWVVSCSTLSICHSAQMLPDCKILSWCHRGPPPGSLSPLLFYFIDYLGVLHNEPLKTFTSQSSQGHLPLMTFPKWRKKIKI